MKPSVPRFASLLLMVSPLLPACGENSSPISPADGSSGDPFSVAPRADSLPIVKSEPVAIPHPQSESSPEIVEELKIFGTKLSSLIQSVPDADRTFKANLIELEVEWTRLESLVTGIPLRKDEVNAVSKTVEGSMPESMTTTKSEIAPDAASTSAISTQSEGSLTKANSAPTDPNATTSADSPDHPNKSKVTDFKTPPSGFEAHLEFVEPLLSIKMVWSVEAGCWLSSEPTSSLNLRDGTMINTFCRQLDLGTQGTFFPANWVFQATPNGYLRVVPKSVPWEDLSQLLENVPTKTTPRDSSSKSGSPQESKGVPSRDGVAGNIAEGAHPDLGAPSNQPAPVFRPATAAPNEPPAIQRPQSASLDSSPAPIHLSQSASSPHLPPGNSAPPSDSGDTKSKPAPAERSETYGVSTPIDQTFTSGPSERKWVFHFDPALKLWRTRDSPLVGEVKEQHRSSVCESWTLMAREDGLLPGWSFVPEFDGNVAIRNKVPPVSEYRPPLVPAAPLHSRSSSGRFVSGSSGAPVNTGAFKAGATTLPDGTLPSVKNSDPPKQGLVGRPFRAVRDFISKPLGKSEKGIE